MLMSSKICRGRGFSLFGVTSVMALSLLATSAPASAQAEECGGWMASCASVQVQADGDQLFFYVPNATLPAELPPEARISAGERLRVLAHADGMTCDPATRTGCVDITESWLDAAEVVRSGSAAAGATAAAADPGNRSCEDEAEWMDPARGLGEEDGRRCGRPAAAFFILALPAAGFLFGADGDDPDVVLPIGGDPELPGGSGADDGSSSSDGGGSSGGAGSGGSDDGSSSGGSGGSGGGGTAGGGNTGGGNTGGGNTGGSNTGGGDTGGGDTGGGLPPGPGTGGTPPMGEVPEPISTTLVGIGLLGYAGARLRQRRMDGVAEEDA